MIQNTGHYYVIVTREALYSLPYSVTEIYGIRSPGKYNSLRPVYHEFYLLYKENLKEEPDRMILVIADGAAFGAYMGQLSIFIKKHHGICLYLPESFEWIILKSGLIDGKYVSGLLNDPGKYIESSVKEKS